MIKATNKCTLLTHGIITDRNTETNPNFVPHKNNLFITYVETSYTYNNKSYIYKHTISPFSKLEINDKMDIYINPEQIGKVIHVQ